MSKILRSILLFFAAFTQILQFFTNLEAQDINLRIKITSDKPQTVEIIGTFASDVKRINPRNLSFLNEYAGAVALAERITDVVLADRVGHPIANKRLNAGEYVSETDISNWIYRVDLKPLPRRVDFAHVSWIDQDIGLLMLDDLLPQNYGEKVTGRLIFDVPAGWKIISTERTISTNEFGVADIEKAVFVITRSMREKEVAIDGQHLRLLISGPWRFSDDEAVLMSAEIYKRYAKIFGSAPSQNTQIALFDSPQNLAIDFWEADTRGNSITIVSSDMPFETLSRQRLHEQLRHEIFHLWMPNGVNLSGNYDWFYEGFALYQSLKLGVAANRIRFDDFLDTLGRAYNDGGGAPPRGISLIEASKNRWVGFNMQVYARGMLVAFLCDLAFLEASKGRRSTDDLVREIYQKYHGVATREDGNAAVIETFRAHAELRSIVDRYITGVDKIEWQDLLSAAGIEVATEHSPTSLSIALKVTAKPSGRQKDLLDKLGYNNWRKLTVNNR